VREVACYLSWLKVKLNNGMPLLGILATSNPSLLKNQHSAFDTKILTLKSVFNFVLFYFTFFQYEQNRWFYEKT
jgi:hypothetical protein